MKLLLVLCAVIAVTWAFPEPPRNNRWGSPPSAPQKQYGAPPSPPPPSPPKQQYGPPQEPQSQWGPPAQEYGPPPPTQEYGPPKQEYGPPAPVYGPPEPEKIVTKNVYVHVPPLEEQDYAPAKQIEVPVPKKHYKIIFIKAPTPPTPTVPIIPIQEPDEHKTLVYVLVKKPEPQPDIVIPTAAPTEPSKPEVFFIKYKQEKEKESQYGPY